MLQPGHPLSEIFTLPFDATENIISFLWNDVPSLSQCTLVCRMWHTAARPFIFRRVVVKTRERFAELETLVSVDETIGYWIRELCIDASSQGGLSARLAWIFNPTSGSHIGNPVTSFPGTTNMGTSTDVFPGTILPQKLKKLHALSFVRIHAIHPRRSGECIRALSKAFAGTVRSLIFKSCYGHDWFFLAFTHAFPHLHDLQLIETRSVDQGPHDMMVDVETFKDEFLPASQVCVAGSDSASTGQLHHAAHSDLRLTTMRIDHYDFANDAAKLYCTKSFRTVQSLDIRHTGPRLHPIDDISSKILPECGRALRHLKLSIATIPSRPRK